MEMEGKMEDGKGREGEETGDKVCKIRETERRIET